MSVECVMLPPMNKSAKVNMSKFGDVSFHQNKAYAGMVQTSTGLVKSQGGHFPEEKKRKNCGNSTKQHSACQDQHAQAQHWLRHAQAQLIHAQH